MPGKIIPPVIVGAKPPKGYRIVPRGHVRKGDLLFVGTWLKVDKTVGEEIPGWDSLFEGCIARKR